MTSQGHVHKRIRKIIEMYFLSAYISKSSAHPSLKLLTVNWGTLKSMMYKFDHDQTKNHRIINKRFGVEEWWSNISREVHDKLLFKSWCSIRRSVEKLSWYRLLYFTQVDPIAECTGSVTTIPTQTLRERIAARSPDRQHSGHDTCNEQPPDCHGVTSRHDDSSQAYCPCCHYKNHCCPDESTGAVR